MIFMRQLANLKSRRTGANRGSAAGFTLLELMIVIFIIIVLLGMAAMRYDRALVRSREAVLKNDLFVIREAIDQFTLDKQAAPQSIEDLHNAGYLPRVPVDPMTQAADWVPDYDNVVMSPDQVTTGITDVHSASPRSSPFEGTPYNTW